MREPSNAWNDRRGRWSWPARLALGGLAFAGSAAYAASFRLVESALMARWAVPVAVAAGASWLAFGAALLLATRRRPSVLAWADACLSVMAVGILVLLGSVLLNLLRVGATGVHLAVLLLSNGAMALVFASRARALGMPLRTSLALWVGVLDGTFLLLLWVMS